MGALLAGGALVRSLLANTTGQCVFFPAQDLGTAALPVLRAVDDGGCRRHHELLSGRPGHWAELCSGLLDTLFRVIRFKASVSVREHTSGLITSSSQRVPQHRSPLPGYCADAVWLCCGVADAAVGSQLDFFGSAASSIQLPSGSSIIMMRAIFPKSTGLMTIFAPRSCSLALAASTSATMNVK